MVKDVVGRSTDIYCRESNKLMSSFLYSIEVPKEEIKNIPTVGDFKDIFEEVQVLPPH